MTGEEANRLACERANDIWIRRHAPGSIDRDLFLGLEARHGVEATATDDSDLCVQRFIAPVVQSSTTARGFRPERLFPLLLIRHALRQRQLGSLTKHLPCVSAAGDSMIPAFIGRISSPEPGCQHDYDTS